MLQLGHVLFHRSLLGEGPRQHELGFEYRSGSGHDAVESSGHPRDGRVPHQALDVSDGSPCIALVPGPVEVLGGVPELYDQVAGEVLRADLAALFAPEPNEGGFVTRP